MTLMLDERNRKVVPRWRDASVMARARELDSLTIKAREVAPVDLLNKIGAWNVQKDIISAKELVTAALVLGQHECARDAANFIQQRISHMPKDVQRSAGEVLGANDDVPHQEPIDIFLGRSSVSKYALAVHDLRESLRLYPFNAIVWTDLARAYAVLGKRAKALKAMQVAIGLAPDNRYVLRSASRLFVNFNGVTIGETKEDWIQRALQILRRSPATRLDPWLMAAEIAITSMTKKSSHLVRDGRLVLKSHNYAPRHLAELASAIATLELKAGDSRRSRQLFNQSLIDPTENAVAQGEWASRRLENLDFDPQVVAIERSHEAQSYKAFHGNKWQESLQHSMEWLNDEPFAANAAVFGSFVAGTAMGDYQTAEVIAKAGLSANPGNTMLLNNLTVNLARQSKLADAERCFAQIHKSESDANTRHVLLATEGLLNFRRGEIDQGRQMYIEVMTAAVSDRRLRLLAGLNWAVEELVHNYATANDIFQQMSDEALKYTDPGVRALAEHLSLKLRAATSAGFTQMRITEGVAIKKFDKRPADQPSLVYIRAK